MGSERAIKVIATYCYGIYRKNKDKKSNNIVPFYSYLELMYFNGKPILDAIAFRIIWENDVVSFSNKILYF